MHNKSTAVHFNGFNSLIRALYLKSLTFRIFILLGFFSSKSANSTVFGMCILFAFFSTISPISTTFRMRILLVTDIYLCKIYRFQNTFKTSAFQKNTPLNSSSVARKKRSFFLRVRECVVHIILDHIICVVFRCSTFF